MRKLSFLIAFIAAMSYLTVAADARVICGYYFSSYGLLNADLSSSDVYYRPNYAGLLFAAVFAPTVIIPVYVLGFDLMTPRGPRTMSCKNMIRRRY